MFDTKISLCALRLHSLGEHADGHHRVPTGFANGASLGRHRRRLAVFYFGRGKTILIERERIKRQTIANRRLLHRRQAA
jgi:hypothetical protein